VKTMTYGRVMLPITPECMDGVAPEVLAPITENWLNDWCADHGALRLEGPPRWRPETLEPHYIQSMLVWPALLP
jgi:hypothetical protein